MFDKMNKCITPTKEDLIGIVENESRLLLRDICTYIESEFNAKIQIDYSVCSGAPGWNFKYKKSGKPVCTIYPEKDKFIILVTLNFDANEMFKIVASSFSQYTQDLVESVKTFNGAKWLMINVDNKAVANDVKKLLGLKFNTKKTIT